MPRNSRYEVRLGLQRDYAAYATYIVNSARIKLNSQWNCDLRMGEADVGFDKEKGFFYRIALDDLYGWQGRIRGKRRTVATIHLVIPKSGLRQSLTVMVNQKERCLIKRNGNLPAEDNSEPHVEEKIIKALTDESGRPLWIGLFRKSARVSRSFAHA